MSWIEEIAPDDADRKLAAIYANLVEKRGKVSNILSVHSLNPEAMQNHLDLYMTIMFGKSGLTRAEREAVAVVVSASNDCAYCIHHHDEALRRYIRDEEVLQAEHPVCGSCHRTTPEEDRGGSTPSPVHPHGAR